MGHDAPVSGQRRERENVGLALIAEAARHDLAADRYEAMGDLVNARRSREHAVALRAAGDAYERRASHQRALREDPMIPPMPNRLPPPLPPLSTSAELAPSQAVALAGTGPQAVR